jgi:phage major head subunit gpT-like protein
MAIVSPDTLAAVRTNFQLLFASEFAAKDAQQGWRDFTSEMPSNAEVESYNWLGVPPQMQDTTHKPLDLSDLEGFNYSITNATYQAALRIKREAIEDDKLGQISPRVSQLAEEAAAHPGRLVLSLLESNPTAYDGVAFFSNSHTNGDGETVDNTLTATVSSLSAVTISEMQDAIDEARATMQLFQDRQGRPMGKVPDTWVCSPQRAPLLYRALNGAGTPGSVSPMLPVSANGIISVGTYKIFTNVLSTNANVMYGLHTTSSVKPLIFQNRLAPSMESVNSPDSESAILRNEFIEAVRARRAAGVGDYTSAIQLTLSE